MNQKQSWEENLGNKMPLFNDPDFDWHRKQIVEVVNESIQQAIQTREREIIEKYGGFNDGCGCCGEQDLKDALKKEKDNLSIINNK